MNSCKFYHTAVYVRLSRDDEDISGIKKESDSISSQKDMLCAYIDVQNDMDVYDIYADDGYSGVNFDRPEFIRMMKDIGAGNVNCVIVKDLSRLGRDYIEAGRLIQKTFPAFCVRFIALTDNYDSLTADFNENALIVPVKNFINDAYSRDISCKVRAHQKIKRENGQFIGAFSIYGYKRSMNDRNKLVRDNYAAEIVKIIFSMKLMGYSNLAIAENLNNAGIFSPLEYKKINGENFQTGFACGVCAKWSAVAVKRILTNENYTGMLVQGREEKINYKIKNTVKKPESEWVRVRGTHDAIVSEEDFSTVQDMLKINMRSENKNSHAHKFSGILFCGNCKRPLIKMRKSYSRQVMKNVFICPGKNRKTGCECASVLEEDLDNIILRVLSEQIPKIYNKENLPAMEKGIYNNLNYFQYVIKTFLSEINKLKNEKNKYLKIIEGLSGDLNDKTITKEEFEALNKIYNLRLDEFEKSIKCHENIVDKLISKCKLTEENKLIREEHEFWKNIKAADRTIIITFIDKIYVFENKKVYIRTGV